RSSAPAGPRSAGSRATARATRTDAMAPRTTRLRLLAQDPDDLAVISAAMQDAVAKVGDITYEAKARLLTIAFNRYCWEAEGHARVRSALQLGGVLKVQTRKIRRGVRDAVLEV